MEQGAESLPIQWYPAHRGIWTPVLEWRACFNFVLSMLYPRSNPSEWDE